MADETAGIVLRDSPHSKERTKELKLDGVREVGFVLSLAAALLLVTLFAREVLQEVWEVIQ